MSLDNLELKTLGPYFGLPEAASLNAVPVRSSSICVTRIAKDVADGERPIVSLPVCDAYFLMVYTKEAHHCDILPDGTRTLPRRFERGSVCLVDLSEGASVVLYADLHSATFLLPRTLIQEVVELSGTSPRPELRCRRGERDQVLSNLTDVILSLFDRQNASWEVLLKHLAIAICSHLIQDSVGETEAGVDDAIFPYNREAAAKEFMRKNLARELSVSEIAAAAGLSANHFSQGFKKVTGVTPHQWLMHARVEAAKDLLRGSESSLKVIAEACGFVDQSHFTKVFSRETGMTPAVWRAGCLN
ncbi:helix-turn-helix transcriptional regulator [Rhizobium sp. P40RR-XXII]|uniref:AraC family transcriptional regulator n=1 Tax=unclassified Rhizobium TaxID=2613769 RepID=UPI0014575120|nr:MULTISPECIES: AraC family transcriptional regulator [unclassified Rhizobium]NLR86016.1 helix-turn-helix transcriptional regulator [Rhizobium sp. P28RR-XV]NLS18830.1 helix-turn-helix transcriptional regulator [Rhizobium sp. P40RR-XXII]